MPDDHNLLEPQKTATPDKSEKRMMGGSLAVSIVIHAILLLIIGSIVIVPAAMEKFMPVTSVAPPPMEIPEPPPMEEAMPSDTIETAGSPISDVKETSVQESEASPMDALVVDSPVANAPRLDASTSLPPLSSEAFSEKLNQSGGGGTARSGKGTGARTTFFGSREKQDGNAGLVGRLIDLKQTKDRKPVDLKGHTGYNDSLKAYQEIIRNFVGKNWDRNVWKDYFIAPKPLYAKQIFIPQIPAKDAPEAFDVAKDVQESRWVIHYVGEMKWNRSGLARFVGTAGEILLVRWNNQFVLDASHPWVKVLEKGVSDWKEPEQPKDRAVFHGNPLWDSQQLVYGNWIPIEAGKTYSLEVLIGERGGGDFYDFLMIDWKADPIRLDTFGRPTHTIFHVTGDPQSVDVTTATAPSAKPTKILPNVIAPKPGMPATKPK